MAIVAVPERGYRLRSPLATIAGWRDTGADPLGRARRRRGRRNGDRGGVGGRRAGGDRGRRRRLESELRQQLGLDLGAHVGVLLQEQPRVLATLTERSSPNESQVPAFWITPLSTA